MCTGYLDRLNFHGAPRRPRGSESDSVPLASGNCPSASAHLNPKIHSHPIFVPEEFKPVSPTAGAALGEIPEESQGRGIRLKRGDGANRRLGLLAGLRT